MTSPATIRHNKDTVRRLLDHVVTKGNLDLIDELFAANVVDHTPLGDSRGRDSVKTRARSLRTAFSDFSATVEELVGEGDMVALRATDRGTHDGVFMGIEATGRKVEYAATAFFRFEEGKIVERWVQPDTFGVLSQLGVLEQSGDPGRQGRHDRAQAARAR